MTTELIKDISGVGALIVIPKKPELGFLTIEERRNKRSSAKLVGMRSLPMETLEGDEDHQRGLERLFKEEISIPNLSTCLTGIKLCRCELTPGVVLHSYLIEIESGETPLIKLGSESAEVSAPNWTSIEEVLQAEGSLRFRPGVFEVVSSYLGFRADPKNFRPGTYTYLRDQVPEEVFDFLDQGFSQTEALSRFGLVVA